MPRFEDEEEIPEQAESPDEDSDERPEPGAASSKESNTITLTRKEWERHEARRKELEASERYWASQAQGKKETPAADDPEPDPDEEDLFAGLLGEDEASDSPEKLVDDISAKGLAALRSRGVLTARQVKDILTKQQERLLRQVRKITRTEIEGERAKYTSDNELVTQFPDLKNPKSELFKRTAEIYKAEVKADPALAKSQRALMMSARTAQAELKAERRAREADAFDSESDRERRIAAQSGGSRRAKSDADDDGYQGIGPEQRRIIAEFGIDEKEYRKEQDKLRRRR